MGTKPLTLVTGRRIRLTQVDSCGRPVFGEASQAISEGFISVALTANTTTTDAIQVFNAAGELCVNRPEKNKFAGYSAEIIFCNVDPDLFAMATGQKAYYDSDGNSIGFTMNTKPTKQSTIALEIWAGTEGSDTCDDPTGEEEYGYILLPFLEGGIVGDFTIENGAANFTITGSASRDGNRWGEGPYPVVLEGGVPATLPTALDKYDHLLAIGTELAPPAAVVGTRPLLDPTATTLTSVTGTVTGSSKTATFAVVPVAVQIPVWYDFGDGTWDWVLSATGATSHTYAKAGTYTVKASTNGVWKTTTVVITGP